MENNKMRNENKIVFITIVSLLLMGLIFGFLFYGLPIYYTLINYGDKNKLSVQELTLNSVDIAIPMEPKNIVELRIQCGKEISLNYSKDYSYYERSDTINGLTYIKKVKEVYFISGSTTLESSLFLEEDNKRIKLLSNVDRGSINGYDYDNCYNSASNIGGFVDRRNNLYMLTFVDDNRKNLYVIKDGNVIARADILASRYQQISMFSDESNTYIVIQKDGTLYSNGASILDKYIQSKSKINLP